MDAEKASQTLAPSMSFATLPGASDPRIEKLKVGGDAVDELSLQFAAESLGARLSQTADSLASEDEKEDAFPLNLNSDRRSNRMSFSFSSSASQPVQSSIDPNQPINPAAQADHSSGSNNSPNDGRSGIVATEALKVSHNSAPTSTRVAYEVYQSLAMEAHKCFLRLRDLPFVGRQPWTVVYQEAFASYSKLWGLQQEERQALVNQGLT